MAQVTLPRSKLRVFQSAGRPAVESKRRIAGPHFVWDPQTECGYLREDLCELPVCVLSVRRCANS